MKLLAQASAHALPLRDESVQCVVTSPPYFGSLRQYAGQQDIPHWGCAMGNEREPALYVDHLVESFCEVRRVLRPDGTAWLNLGDAYAASGKGGGGIAANRTSWATTLTRKGFRMPPPGYKMKDLTLAPFQVADALRRDGWYLRATIVWAKPTAIEPSRHDRPSVSHEYLFLLARSEHYAAHAPDPGEPWWNHSVWNIPSGSFAAHPGTMPEELVRRCLIVGSRPGDVVLDPFCGSSTVGRVALRLGRSYVGLDLSREYLTEHSVERLRGVQMAVQDNLL